VVFREKATRLQYYLQLRDNLLNYSQSVSEEKCFLLAGLALQADFGNFDQQRHIGAYFDPREFFPAWVSWHDELMQSVRVRVRSGVSSVRAMYVKLSEIHPCASVTKQHKLIGR